MGGEELAVAIAFAIAIAVGVRGNRCEDPRTDALSRRDNLGVRYRDLAEAPHQSQRTRQLGRVRHVLFAGFCLVSLGLPVVVAAWGIF